MQPSKVREIPVSYGASFVNRLSIRMGEWGVGVYTAHIFLPSSSTVREVNHLSTPSLSLASFVPKLRLAGRENSLALCIYIQMRRDGEVEWWMRAKLPERGMGGV